VPVVEPLICGTGDQLSSVETDLVLLTLRRFDESVAPTLSVTGCEMKLLINSIKSQRRIATTGNSLASTAIAQVSTATYNDNNNSNTHLTAFFSRIEKKPVKWVLLLCAKFRMLE